MTRKLKNIIGQKFGRLVVVGSIVDISNRRRWVCVCKCKNITVVRTGHLNNGSIQSCGCFGREISRNNAKVAQAANVKHGLSYSRTYCTWRKMKERCLDPKNNRFHRYGARGIKIVPSWLKFENFLADMGERPEGRSLDRINNNGDYSKTNCRWATPKEQAANQDRPRRKNVEL